MEKRLIIGFLIVSLIVLSGCVQVQQQQKVDFGNQTEVVEQEPKIYAIPENKDTTQKISNEKCNDFCQAYEDTIGECGAEIGDLAGSKYCEGDIQCVCLPQPCSTDEDCKKYNRHFICSVKGCIYPGCSYACREFYGYMNGVCGGTSGKDIGSAYCAHTFEQCMCSN